MASFLQVVVDMVKELVDETEDLDGTIITTFSFLKTKLKMLLIDNVGGNPAINITASSDDDHLDLVVDIEISWLFTETEQDCQWVLSDFFSGLDLKDNNGLSYIANALLQEMEKQVSQLPVLLLSTRTWT